jgi:UDPglucose 6-dehydrogenase
MNVAVAGLWHLGCVIAAGSARAGHRVAAYDPDPATRDGVALGKAPLFEPGLNDALSAALQNGSLAVAGSPEELLKQADLLWIAYDTPVRDDDTADTAFVRQEILRLLLHAPAGLMVLVSSQLPAGSLRELETQAAITFPGRGLRFACSPENLRLGQALAYFMKPDRIVAGVRTEADKALLADLWAPLGGPVEWMSVESAEMTKHAINAFLALSVTFANELATLCEKVGADGREVERGLKTESRIGPRAYVRPGRAFDGGTLARDVLFLSAMGAEAGLPLRLIPSIQAANEAHKQWLFRAVSAALTPAPRPVIAVLGLTYKPGTDTLRRSTALAFCRQAAAAGWRVQAHDPRVGQLPDAGAGLILCPDIKTACAGAQGVVVAADCPEFKAVSREDWAAWAPGAWVVDPARFLADTLGRCAGSRYRAVGMKGDTWAS